MGSNILEVRDRLKCRPFSWFLRRFKALYEDSGMIPEAIFMLKDENSGLCLRYEGEAGTSGDGFGWASLSSCTESDDRMFWHLGNKDRSSAKCCSGFRAWNIDQCVWRTDNGKIKTAVCDVSGRNGGQHWRLT